MAGMIRRGLSVAVLATMFAPAWADIVKLKDGREFDGKIIEQNENEVKLKTKFGAMSWKREDILEIIEQKSLLETMDERLLALNPSDARAYLETGKWVIEEVDHEGIGLRLVNLAMALDPKLFGDGQLYLGDYYYGKKSDRKKAAQCYQRALLADPTNPACNERYEKVKDTIQDSGSACDQKLVNGLRGALQGNFELAQDELESGRNSVMRLRAEEILGAPIQDVIDYCVSKTGCKSCKGNKFIVCRSCNGKMEDTCGRCGGKGYSVVQSVRRNTTKICPDCKGWGLALCMSCKPVRKAQQTTYQNRTYVEPAVPDESKEYVVKPTYTLEGGKEPCKVCRGKTAREVGPPDSQKLQAACDSVDRQLKGQLTLWEQSLTRMPRVGGPGQIENARDLLDHPVWWDGDFVTIEKRRGADPNFGKGGGAVVADAALARKGAQALVPGAEAPAQFELTLRRTLGLGGAAAAGQKQVYYTDFAPRAAGASAPAGVPNVEVSNGGSRLNACLVEIAEEFSARRIDLDMGDGTGVSLAEALQSGAWGTSGAVVRVFYTVVDSNEAVTPGKDRDTVVTRLVVKLTLVDVLDAGGQVLQTTR